MLSIHSLQQMQYKFNNSRESTLDVKGKLHKFETKYYIVISRALILAPIVSSKIPFFSSLVLKNKVSADCSNPGKSVILWKCWVKQIPWVILDVYHELVLQRKAVFELSGPSFSLVRPLLYWKPRSLRRDSVRTEDLSFDLSNRCELWFNFPQDLFRRHFSIDNTQSETTLNLLTNTVLNC